MRDVMRVKVEIDTNLTEMTATIHAPKITPRLTALVTTLEGVEDNASFLIAKKDDKIFVVEPDQIELIRIEGNDIILYNREAQAFTMTKTLQEIYNSLTDNFVRISKSVIVNINRVDHLSNSFNSTMYIAMKNGVSDYISRKYLGDFKKRLGI